MNNYSIIPAGTEGPAGGTSGAGSEGAPPGGSPPARPASPRPKTEQLSSVTSVIYNIAETLEWPGQAGGPGGLT